MSEASHLTADERYEQGRSLRNRLPRSGLAEWAPAADRPDPFTLLEQQNGNRLPWLVPVRRGRMTRSAFAFFRGGARLMASDLAATPVTGLDMQICGDAHLANFGFYASPERRLVFDINDFDETLPGPWEWDVMRLAASFMIAGRHNELDEDECRRVTERAVRWYRKATAILGKMRTLDIWYALIDEVDALETADGFGREKAAGEIVTKAKTKQSRQALDRLAVEVDGEYRIRSEPPLLVPLREIPDAVGRRDLDQALRTSFENYQQTVSDNCRRLLQRFRIVDAGLKVVGVGSVGTRCCVLLLEGRDRKDPLFLQIKEASDSVLEEFLPASSYDNHGRRVVEGQRLMQTVSDIFLGWTRGLEGQDYYWRQLRDWKGSADVEDVQGADLQYLAKLCGWTLARAHARSGDSVTLAGYLGKSEVFDRAMTEFAGRYADQVELDFASYVGEIDANNLEVVQE